METGDESTTAHTAQPPAAAGRHAAGAIRQGRGGVRRRIAVRGTTALLAAALLALALPVTAPATPFRQAGATDTTPPPIDLAIAVDESGSLSADDVERERDAADRIAVSEVNAQSRITVLGFASATRRGQTPVDEVCPTTALSPVAKERMGSCVGKLAKREKGQGDGTDFPAAIRQAVNRLTTNSTGGPRMLFLLTDGLLNVNDSPSYGQDVQSRERNSRLALAAALDEARKAQVQIWPLGFGSADPKALADMAAAGYQGACTNLAGATPKATVVDSAALGSTLQSAFAGARCLVTDEPQEGKPPADIYLRISPLATLATIVVSKGDAAVTADFYDPQGTKVRGSGEADGSHLQLSGAEQEVESLQITDPRPGRWRVHLDAPADHRSKLATVGVQWRGALRSSITLTPAAPHPGQQAAVQLHLQTRDGLPVTDPADVQTLQVSAELSGDGFDDRPITLRNDGSAGEGTFSGAVTVPATATGALEVVGVLGAVGLSADHRPFVTRIAVVNPDVTAYLDVSHADDKAGARLNPGKHVSFVVKAANTATTTHTLRVQLLDTRPGDLSVTPTAITLKPGESTTVTGRLMVGDQVPQGELSGRLQVFDTAHPGQPLDARLITVRVVPEPGAARRVWDAWWPAIVAVLLLLAGLAAWLVVRHRITISATDPGGLELCLLEAGAEEEEEEEGERSKLVVRSSAVGKNGWYGFAVVRDNSAPRLAPMPVGPYFVRRDRNRLAQLRQPGSAQTSVRYRQSVPVDQGRLRLRIDPGTRATRAPGTWLPSLLRPRPKTTRQSKASEHRPPTRSDSTYHADM
ncbi:vWA domain-containing protein [Streptomyces sp. SPB162]|uniref:vWA domain-containing protein n=1 Tax=Streptomyces sp. SPB162 TaxID=2940560 RepID=UPI0024075C7F|nr:vWA domain-containing protein [Streptomyces sp. SPB162]MDF9817075.1 hypothetical protein [Streptomyces sp. SPB162]